MWTYSGRGIPCIAAATRLAGAVSRWLIVLVGAFVFTAVNFAADCPPQSAAELAEHNPIAELRVDAEKGNSRAQFMLGCCYNGDFGLPQDSIEAARWWKKAAANGHSEAEYCLGLCYYQGQGVPKDIAEGARWWRKAADQGHANAEYFLGLVYRAGLGVPKSTSLATYWLNKSANSGVEAAAEALAEIKKTRPPLSRESPPG